MSVHSILFNFQYYRVHLSVWIVPECENRVSFAHKRTDTRRAGITGGNRLNVCLV